MRNQRATNAIIRFFFIRPSHTRQNYGPLEHVLDFKLIHRCGLKYRMPALLLRCEQSEMNVCIS